MKECSTALFESVEGNQYTIQAIPVLRVDVQGDILDILKQFSMLQLIKTKK